MQAGHACGLSWETQMARQPPPQGPFSTLGRVCLPPPPTFLFVLNNAPIQKALGPTVLSTISLSTENPPPWKLSRPSGWKQFCSEIVGHSFLSSEHLPPSSTVI